VKTADVAVVGGGIVGVCLAHALARRGVRHVVLLEGLYVATGFGGSGFKIAPAVAIGLAELIVDGESRTVDIRPFGLRRFQEGRKLEGPHPYALRRDHLERGAEPAREPTRARP
jgi:glycine/D-amino acid oxidase-like deaminating enzyme